MGIVVATHLFLAAPDVFLAAHVHLVAHILLAAHILLVAYIFLAVVAGFRIVTATKDILWYMTAEEECLEAEMHTPLIELDHDSQEPYA
jgi:Na+-transporting NADH:ubiquinone oxidoreductase subunit NqrB